MPLDGNQGGCVRTDPARGPESAGLTVEDVRSVDPARRRSRSARSRNTEHRTALRRRSNGKVSRARKTGRLHAPRQERALGVGQTRDRWSSSALPAGCSAVTAGSSRRRERNESVPPTLEPVCRAITAPPDLLAQRLAPAGVEQVRVGGEALEEVVAGVADLPEPGEVWPHAPKCSRRLLCLCRYCGRPHWPCWFPPVTLPP
jgi:hypothetical protein